MSCSAARNCQHLRNDRGTGRLAEALPRVTATVGDTSDAESNSTLRRNRRERRWKNDPIGIVTFSSIDTGQDALADAAFGAVTGCLMRLMRDATIDVGGRCEFLG